MPSVEAPSRYPLLEEGKKKSIESTYGAGTLRSLQVADLTRSVILLRGRPGVGKSRLALDLMEDPSRERTLVVPVSGKWTATEDLLGSRNGNTFEPTQFTNFMRAAELAWRSGDFDTRLVVFENFDLSPPEAWLSEILVRCQYPAHSMGDRTISLGGETVRGWASDAGSRLLVSPAVRFVATLDEPVRLETLRQRLLDHVGIVDIDISASQALKIIAPGVSPKQTDALVALDAVIRPVHAGLTFSTAVAIRTCLGQLEELGVDAWKAIDFVLEQELVGKVELLNLAKVDETVAHEAIAWSEGPGKKFVRCAARLASWGDRITQTHIFEGS